jgi:hypothetical protein
MKLNKYTRTFTSNPAVLHTMKIMQDLRFSRRWLSRMASSGMLSSVTLVRTDVSEELSASFISLT